MPPKNDDVVIVNPPSSTTTTVVYMEKDELVEILQGMIKRTNSGGKRIS